jgi:hypothetical protein
MLRSVTLVRTDVSEERSASIFIICNFPSFRIKHVLIFPCSTHLVLYFSEVSDNSCNIYMIGNSFVAALLSEIFVEFKHFHLIDKSNFKLIQKFWFSRLVTSKIIGRIKVIVLLKVFDTIRIEKIFMTYNFGYYSLSCHSGDWIQSSSDGHNWADSTWIRKQSAVSETSYLIKNRVMHNVYS